MVGNSGTRACGQRRCVRGALAFLPIAVVLAAQPARADDGDPLEPVNRAIFSFNEVVDGLILAPAAELYGLLVPDLAKEGIGNVLGNLRAPAVFVNRVLQGQREQAGVTFGRFLVNSTLGVGGIFDMASQFGLEAEDPEDFGQTLGHYGVGDKPYLVLPILGPSNPRDALGRAVDGVLFDPMFYVAPTEARLSRTVTEGVDLRHELDPLLDDLKEGSLDHYAAMRSAFRQRRAAEVRGDDPAATDPGYDAIFEEDFE